MWVAMPREFSVFKYLGEIFMKTAYSTNFKSNLQKLEDCIFQFGTFSELYHRARHFNLNCLYVLLWS